MNSFDGRTSKGATGRKRNLRFPKGASATKKDFKLLFGAAKAHGLSFENVLAMARVELGKPLGDFSKKEVSEFAHRICAAFHDGKHA